MGWLPLAFPAVVAEAVLVEGMWHEIPVSPPLFHSPLQPILFSSSNVSAGSRVFLIRVCVHKTVFADDVAEGSSWQSKV